MYASADNEGTYGCLVWTLRSCFHSSCSSFANLHPVQHVDGGNGASEEMNGDNNNDQ